ncbi:zinc-ribbon domain-containing protein [Devosia ginsengisoli]|uniref:zinc-ribbon domain-containing protein n=1 Tax=Devosia ginsengisoli TaxID=400770 RepID=UPI0026EF23FC|nr:zinc-ribbon domain-containing protein [Devosia ginsengisoli]MCR6672254.1 zinc-ribbon domain-containing protein [Devosia ginsengisoli]
MIITCPHCQTKYQVTYEAIGSAGRKVQCAHCRRDWQQQPLEKEEEATPEQKQAFAVMEEDGLDEVMSAEERAVAAEVAQRLELERQAEALSAAKADAAILRRRQRAFTRRQTAMAADLPLARLRRTLRIAGFVLLGAILLTAYFGRVQVVERFPAMAGVYGAVGLGVNVVGLDFSNVSSLRTLRDGKEVLVVSAQIVGKLPEPVTVPPVVVTLVDEQGNGIYEWSVTPSVRDLMAGERATFDTQLTLPPGEAARVRLSFAGGQSTPIVAAETRAAETPAAAGSDNSILPEQH